MPLFLSEVKMKTCTVDVVTKKKMSLVTTREAARMLGLSMYTLRKWACKGGPIQPVVRGKRNPLWWSLDEVKKLVIERSEQW